MLHQCSYHAINVYIPHVGEISTSGAIAIKAATLMKCDCGQMYLQLFWDGVLL